MSRTLLVVAMWLLSLGVQAGGSASVSCSGYQPVLSVSYNTGVDAGKPGLFWVGVTNPGQTQAGYVDQGGSWQPYEGGLYPPRGVYRSGLPGGLSVSTVMPSHGYGQGDYWFGGQPTNTGPYAGWTIYVGHGILTAKAQQQVKDRRTFLNSVKAERVKAGKWNAAYDDDDRYMWSLIQKDMVDNSKGAAVLVVPYVDCNPQYYNWGS